MKVICPYTWHEPLIRKILRQERPEIEFIEMRGDDDYWKLLCELWERRETVVIVEHDIIPWPGAIQALLDCPYHWCSYTYSMKGGYGIHHGLGCTKLDTQFMDKFPDVWVNIDSTNWKHLDAQLSQMARFNDFYPHPHNPPVTHVKDLI
jgi:hypothetical protein